MKCELTAEEYRDTVRALDSKYFDTFIGDKSAYITFKDTDEIVLERVYAVEEVSEERYFQYQYIPKEYIKTSTPTVKIKINSWKELQTFLNEISAIQKEMESADCTT